MNTAHLPQASILQKAYNAILEAIPVIERLPKSQKFTLGDKLQNLLSEILELLIEAHYAPKAEKVPLLQKVNIKLEKLRFFTRLCFDLGYLSVKQYEAFVHRHDEVGRMTGGWIKSLQ
jgi:23S rRNA-intervening sequence protein